MVTSLVYRIQEARERSQSVCDKNASSMQITAILETLIIHLKPKFLGLLTSHEVTNHFGNLLLSSPVEYSIMVLMNSVRSCCSSTLWHILTILNCVEESKLERLLCDSLLKDASDVSWMSMSAELSKSFKHLPDILHNAVGTEVDRQKSSAVFLSNHFIHLRKSMKIAFERAYAIFEKQSDVNLRLLGGVFPAFLYKSEERPQNIIWQRLTAKLLLHPVNGFMGAEKVVQNVVLHSSDGSMLQKLFGDEIVNSSVVRRILFQLMLLIRVYNEKQNVPRKLAECLKAGNCDGSSIGLWSKLHIEAVCDVLHVWSQSSHVFSSSDEKRTYISHCALYLVKCANEYIRPLIASKVNQSILLGVENHLKCLDTRQRSRGLLVGETLIKWLSLGDLHFDNLHSTDDTLTDLYLIIEDNLIPKLEPNNEHINAEKNSDLPEAIPALTDEILSEKVDSDDCSDDEFPIHRTPSSELHFKASNDDSYVSSQCNVKPPLYIRDCLEMLSEKENFSKFEAAFNALNHLIRRRAVSYDDIAETLVRRVITLSDNFSTSDFEVKRLEILTSCLEMSPHLASVAIDIMYSRSCCMANRFLILDALAAAASNLSNYKSSDSIETKSPIVYDVQSDEIECVGEASEHWRVIVDKRIEGNTRRYNKGKRELKATKNRFAAVCQGFFYPLTAMEQFREHLDLINVDYMLLARILFTLGHILQCAKLSPYALKMASTLAEYLLLLRNHEQGGVRQSALICYYSICSSLPNKLFLNSFAGQIVSWLEYARSSAAEDPNKECRELSLLLMKCLHDKISSLKCTDQ